jgi:hypothetical protein
MHLTSDNESVERPGKCAELSDILGQLWLHILEPVLHSLEVSCLIYVRICRLVIVHAVAPKTGA